MEERSRNYELLEEITDLATAGSAICACLAIGTDNSNDTLDISTVRTLIFDIQTKFDRIANLVEEI